MIPLLRFISLFWALRTLKAVLFWIYLWQLKEYHVWRFFDHFRTYKGKKIFLNFLFFFKVLLLALLFKTPEFALLCLSIVYLIEAVLVVIKSIKRPRFTLKTISLTLMLVVIVFTYLYTVLEHAHESHIAIYLLLFDIVLPLIASAIVLLIQPFFVLLRSNILKKAKTKIAKYKDIIVIGITGSYGKTSTKEFLATILASKFKVLATKEHKNSEMGIAETILKELTSEHQIFIVEMGAYSKGGIDLLCDMVKPNIGMVTGVNAQHLSTFRSMENLLFAEGGRELLTHLPQDGLLVVNGDNKYCLDLYKKAHIDKKVYTMYGNKVHSDIWAEEISASEILLDFMVVTKEKEVTHMNVDVLGKQNVQNLLGTIVVAKELGMSLEEISGAAKNIRQKQAGITLHKGIEGLNIIDSSYSSNPDGVMADLEYLNIFKGKKVIIMPCLIELGKKSADVHYQIGKKIAEVCNIAIITTRDKFEELKDGALENGMQKSQVLLAEHTREIMKIIKKHCRKGDTILLEGRVQKELIQALILK